MPQSLPPQSILEAAKRADAFFMGTSPIHAAIERLAKAMGEMQIPFAIAGAMAANAHGHSRTTADVDILIRREDLARFNALAHMVIVTVKAMDHAQENVLTHLRTIRDSRPSRPVIGAITCLHEAYPQQQHVQPYPFRGKKAQPEAPRRSEGRLAGSYDPAVLLRTDGLSEAGRLALEVGAVLGVRFDPALVGRLTGAEDALLESVERGLLLDDGGELGFRHALTQETLYQDIPPQRRRALHREIARQLEVQRAPPGLRATHWLHAREAEPARKALLVAAEASCAVHAYRDALRAARRRRPRNCRVPFRMSPKEACVQGGPPILANASPRTLPWNAPRRGASRSRNAFAARTGRRRARGRRPC
jgi:hypothetical protein